MLPEITQPPRILTSITAPMTPEFQSKLQNYLDKRSPVSFPPEITSQLQVVKCMINLASRFCIYSNIRRHCLC